MFYEEFTKLCDKKMTSKSKVLAEIGISSGNLPKWRNGRIPKIEILNKIAEYFDVTVDELLGNEQTEDKELTEYLEFLKYRPEGKMLFSVAKGCTKEEVEQAVKIIEALRNKGDE